MLHYPISEQYNKFFKVKFANDKNLRTEAFKIRHKVYSEELGWEPENVRKLEIDEWDNHAHHCLLYHKRTSRYIGCIRLVIPPPSKPNTKLPFEKSCLDSAYTSVVNSRHFARGSFGEISRLAILDEFRRIQSANTKTATQFHHSDEEKRFLPNLAIGLYFASLALADLCQHTGVFVMMEPKLNKRLKRLGLPFVQAGATMDYHGMRAMFFLDRKDFCKHLSDDYAHLYHAIHHDLSQQLNLIPYSDYKQHG